MTTSPPGAGTPSAPEASRTAVSPPELLVLHAVRLTGVAGVPAVATRIGLDPHLVSELLLDGQALGWVTLVEFAGLRGWALTERGRAEDDDRLIAEVAQAGCRDVVDGAHRAFEILNARLVRACTDWQIRPAPDDRFAANDHTDVRWDGRVLDELTALGDDMAPLVGNLSAALARFGGYDERFTVALSRARAGEGAWVAGVGIPSCHAVWMELHEDLLSTLGKPRHPRRSESRTP